MPMRTKSFGCWLWRRGCKTASFTCPAATFLSCATIRRTSAECFTCSRRRTAHCCLGRAATARPQVRQASGNEHGWCDGQPQYAGGSPSSLLTLFAVINDSPAIACHAARSAGASPRNRAPNAIRPATPEIHHCTTPFFLIKVFSELNADPAGVAPGSNFPRFHFQPFLSTEFGYAIAEDGCHYERNDFRN